MTRTKQTVLEELAAQRPYVPDRIIARRVVDAAIKRGRVEELALAAEVAQAIAIERARGPLADAVGDVLLSRSSGPDPLLGR